MGIEVAPQRQKSRRQQLRERPEEPGESLQRSWRDVNKARLVLGLGVAPIVPCAAFWVWIGFRHDFAAIGELISFSIPSTGLAMCYFIGVGLAFMFWLGRKFGVVERFNCLALCASLTFSMPPLNAVIDLVAGPRQASTDGLSMMLAALALGLALAPLGIVGGWILWRVAIRPAEAPLHEVAKVF